ncbi:MAG: FAD binding domain-containing protein, partial [Methylobacteriaceae bacterium]|nr:FAD binding domain-containing protein [Methylobacteriaceae bacterium]
MHPFAYTRAATIAEALAVGAQAAAAYLAGGTELLNWMRLGIAVPQHVVDISRLADLDRVEPLPDGGLRIGALTRLNDAAQCTEVVRDYPVLSQA